MSVKEPQSRLFTKGNIALIENLTNTQNSCRPFLEVQLLMSVFWWIGRSVGPDRAESYSSIIISEHFLLYKYVMSLFPILV